MPNKNAGTSARDPKPPKFEGKQAPKQPDREEVQKWEDEGGAERQGPQKKSTGRIGR